MLFNIHTHKYTGRQIEVVSRTFGDVVENYFSFGIHPWDAKIEEDLTQEFIEIARNKKCLALGEIGLDKLKGPDLAIQKAVFIQQIEISEKLGLPVIIHCVRSWNELKQLKKELQPTQPWIFHGFNKIGILDDVLKANLIISIGNALLTNKKLQACFSTIPIEKLFLETDDADVTINEIYQKVSGLKNISLEQLEAQIEQNFKRIFTKWTIG